MTGISIGNDENKTPGPAGSGGPGNGDGLTDSGQKVQNSTDYGQIRKTQNKKTAPLPAVRATGLRGQEITRHQSPKSTYRRQTQQDLYGRDPDIPYVKFEAAFRDLVCSLMERQDRMNEEIFLKLNDLGYRVEDIEQELQERGGGR
jgi:hypothetical protein